jgi:hypothetical protein
MIDLAEAPFHVGIATPDVEELMRALGPIMSLTWVDLPRPPVEHDTPHGHTKPSSRVVWSSEGPMHIELVQSEPGTIYAPDRGTHLHHVGYWVDDVSAAVARAEASGWTLEATMMDQDGRLRAFAYMSRPGDVWVELVDSANRETLGTILCGSYQPESYPW